MLKKTIHRSLKAVKIIGMQSTAWLVVGMLSGLGLSFIEIQIAVFIQLFLQALGFKIEMNNSFLGFFGSNHAMSTLMWILASLGILRALAQFAVSQSACMALELINARLKLLALHDLLLNSKFKYVSAAETNARFAEIFPKTAYFFFYLGQCAPQVIVALGVMLVLFKISFPAAIIGLVGLGLITLVLYGLNIFIRSFALAVPKEQGQLLAGVERVTRNWLLIKVLRTHDTEYKKLSDNVMNYAWHGIRANIFANVGTATPPALGVILLVGIILVSVNIFHTPSSEIVTFLYLFLRMVQTLSVAAGHLGQAAVFFPQAKITASYFDTFTDEEVEKTTLVTNRIVRSKPSQAMIEKALHEKARDLPSDVKVPSIAIDQAWFRYDKNKKHILENLTLNVQAREQLAIIGRSGSGKSTLLAVIFGILKLEKGSVKIDDLESSEYFNRYSHRIGYVGAEPFLIEGSIKDNLDYGASRTYTQEEYKVALQEASLWSFVSSLPEAMNYKIEENGGGLSAGQKQRVSIARALLRNPVLLILDEVTANLDAETEREITTSIAALKHKTSVIIISHRPEAIKFADRVIELSEN